MNILVIIGTAHTVHEPGKQSPDGRLIEAVYSREIAKLLMNRLRENDYKAIIDFEQLSLPKHLLTQNYKTNRNRELNLRVRFVNDICREEGKKNVIYVSLHVNAAGNGISWMGANGWQCMVSPSASPNSILLAQLLAKSADEHGLIVRKPEPSVEYWKQSLYVLNNTSCPAIMTENLFQDNIDDVNFLLSDAGKEIIVDLHYKGITNYINNICKG